MTDTVDKEKRSSIMRAVKSKDTSPEMYVRRALHSMGLRYRLHAKRLPGRPDLVFKRAKTVVFINGCFWHWHGCSKSRFPSSNVEYWRSKIDGNLRRDEQSHELLKKEGWSVLIIWECQLDDGVRQVASHILRHKK